MTCRNAEQRIQENSLNVSQMVASAFQNAVGPPILEVSDQVREELALPVPPVTDRPADVVLVGARGHGRWHLDNLRRLQAVGAARLVGVCDPSTLTPAELQGFDDVFVTPDLGVVLTRTRPDVTVICTPIHTHADLAVEAMHHGSHVLLEKPPAPTWTEYHRIAAAAEATGRACQIGFQDLGSTALPEIRRLVDDGVIGELRGIGAACAWVRPRSYFTRSPWSGRRSLDGVPVVDGALTNPFAHATASALRLAGATSRDQLCSLETELYHANDIEADDTSCLRIRTGSGVLIVVAATLCAAENRDPAIVLHGTGGRITLRYKVGEVTVESERERWTRRFPRRDLLENLLAHTAGQEALLSPVTGMGAFMHVVEAVRRAPDPLPVPGLLKSDDQEHVVIPGIDEAVTTACESLALFSELDLPWAPPRHQLPELTSLEVGGLKVASYVDGGGLQTTVSPRPFFHPVTTLAGVEVTDALPLDHVWHLGAGVALQDVGGNNLWGGRTFVRDVGYTWRDDHGRIVHAGWEEKRHDGFVELLDWYDRAGTRLLSERREVGVGEGPGDDAWHMSLRFTLRNERRHALPLGSPGSNGRPAGGYGGFFWRLPPHAGELSVFTQAHAGETAVHGARTPWVAVAGTSPRSEPWTVVVCAADERTAEDPWFVRSEGYPGVGSSLAWQDPVVLGPGESTTRAFEVLVLDVRLSHAGAVTDRVSQLPTLPTRTSLEGEPT